MTSADWYVPFKWRQRDRMTDKGTNRLLQVFCDCMQRTNTDTERRREAEMKHTRTSRKVEKDFIFYIILAGTYTTLGRNVIYSLPLLNNSHPTLLFTSG